MPSKPVSRAANLRWRATTYLLWMSVACWSFSIKPHAVGAAARIRLQTTDVRSNVISSINVGEPFLLQAFLSDLRPRPQGVFSAYSDVEYRPVSLVRVTGPPVFAPPYTNGKSGDSSTPGLLNEIGSFDGISPTGAGEKLQFSVRFLAEAPGRISFQASPADEFGHEVLLYGVDARVQDVEYVGTTLAVTPRPLAFVRIDLRSEGARLTLSGTPNLPFQIQAASNLIPAQWQVIGSNQVIQPDGAAQFLDVNAPHHPARFYRAQQLP